MGMKVIKDIRELIGNTPLLQLQHLELEPSKVYGKLEYFNPGGSVKDRVGIEILKQAKERGMIVKGTTIIEATAGNTGLGLAVAALHEGYHVILVVPNKFAVEKQVLMKALGAEVILTPKELGMKGAIEKAKALQQQIPNSFIPNQFENRANIDAHRITGKEIYEVLEGQIDLFVAGAGSGGTFVGIASYLKEQNPNIKTVLADPIGSIIGGGEPGMYHIEGIGNHFIPTIMDIALVDAVEKITEEEALYYVNQLAKKEGVLVGPSSGAAMSAVIKQIEKATRPLNIVTVFSDRSDRYFSQTLYS